MVERFGKVTKVPLCGGVPPDSMTCAMMLVVPLAGSTVASDVSVMVEPVGASSGTFSHAAAIIADAATMAAKADGRRRRDIMKTITILIPMDLAGQAGQKCTGQRGYAMAVLLVAMSVMAIMFTVVMPVWKQTARREKEEELVFRGRQYVHAIGLFQRKFANAFPPNLDVLVEQRFLRKKFKDRITNDDFVPFQQGRPRRRSGHRVPARARRREHRDWRPWSGTGHVHDPARDGSDRRTAWSARAVRRAAAFRVWPARAKINRIRLYNGRGHYNEWAFIYIQQQQAAGAGGAPGSGTPGRGGQRGQPGQQPGPFPGGNQPGQRGRGGPFGPGGPSGRGNGGIGTFGGGGVTPIQPPSTPRGRF